MQSGISAPTHTAHVHAWGRPRDEVGRGSGKGQEGRGQEGVRRALVQTDRADRLVLPHRRAVAERVHAGVR